MRREGRGSSARRPARDRYQQAKRALRSSCTPATPAHRDGPLHHRGRAAAPETFVLLRGNPHVQGRPGRARLPRGPRRGPAYALPPRPPGRKSSGRRLALADWIAACREPALSPRVMANRIWQHHFGRGIVRSSNNLGLQGDKPTPSRAARLAGGRVHRPEAGGSSRCTG